ncbi:uncharacterized protein LOC134261907 [Saccostrea cucullata]|uniref:uncharacterized protein LOC134261907 n=1 Tax=Saccostrea cuccullata TaxID=36930 RepID=UPI002ED0E74D
MKTDVLDLLVHDEDLAELLESSSCSFEFHSGMSYPVVSCGFTSFTTRESYARHWETKHKLHHVIFYCSIPGFAPTTSTLESALPQAPETSSASFVSSSIISSSCLPSATSLPSVIIFETQSFISSLPPSYVAPPVVSSATLPDVHPVQFSTETASQTKESSPYSLYSVPVEEQNNVTGSFCCTNFDKDKNGDCNVCAPGYFGKLCDVPCPRGKFGRGCAGECTCSLEECDHVSGCPFISQLNTTQAVTVSISPSHQGLNLTEIQISTPSTSSRLIKSYFPISITKSENASISPAEKRYITMKSSTIFQSSEIQTTEISAVRTTLGQFNSNYTILGVGLILAVLLIVIIVQLRVRSKSSHKTISKEEMGDNNEINVLIDSSCKPLDVDKKQYSRLEENKDKGHVYQRVESEYQEIEECLELVDNPSVPRRGFQSNIMMSGENNFLETYIDPVISTENISRQRHSYIEILDTEVYTADDNLNDECNENTSKSSSSYDDVIVECATDTPEIDQSNSNTYLDVLFE